MAAVEGKSLRVRSIEAFDASVEMVALLSMALRVACIA
jgi:hypothetical protein